MKTEFSTAGIGPGNSHGKKKKKRKETKWLNPFTVHLKLTTLLISYIPIQNKQFKIKKKLN